jgi:Erythromycin esterase
MGHMSFYQQRAVITKRLIKEKQFTAVAVEADWPDAYRVNRFVAGYPSDTEAIEALSDFKRFPTWIMPMCSILSDGFGNITINCRLGNTSRASTALTSTAYTLRFKLFWITWRRLILTRRDAPDIAMPVSSTLVRMHNNTGMPRD